MNAPVLGSDYDYDNYTGSGGAGDGGGGAEHQGRNQAESNPGRSQMKARPRMLPIRFSREKTNKQGEHQRQQAQTQHEEALHNDPTFLTDMDFSQLPHIHIATKRAVTERLAYRSMTEIQAQTFGPILAGRSVLARSRTGHGKTLAFLLPTLERILKSNEKYGQSVRVLIVSPTRELALQIAETASTLVTYHTVSKHDNSSLNVSCLFGGTKYAKDVALLSHQSIPTILVCTPGRLVDHLETTRIRGRKFCDLFATTSVLVLDEADSLLQGFPREMKKIVHYLPRSDKRQTLLFSATLPSKLKRSFDWVLPEDYVTVDTAASNNVDNKRNHGVTHGSSETDTQVKQSYVLVRSMDSYISSLVSIILHFVRQERTTTPAHKIMVFLPTARLVKFFAEWFQVGFYHTKESKQNKNPRTFQMHSRMSQSARRRASKDFRHAKHAVLFTTDISSRGMDYPDVTAVLQYGCPDTKEGYVHRIGRTGRAGKLGMGVLVLMPFEERLLTGICGRGGLERSEVVQGILDSHQHDKDMEAWLRPGRSLLRKGDRTLLSSSEASYLSLLAFYSARADKLGLTAEQVLDIGHCFAVQAGLQHAPSLPEALANKLRFA